VLTLLIALATALQTGTHVPVPACDSAAPNPAQFSLAGTVRDSITGTRLPNARVIAITPISPAETVNRHEFTSDDDGNFLLCLNRVAVPIHIYADHQGRLSRPVEVRTDATPDALTLLVARGISARVSGQIVESGSKHGVANARITLRDLGLVQASDKKGRFAFSEVPPGSYEMQVTHSVLVTRTDSVVVANGIDLELIASLGSTVIALEPLIAKAMSRRLEHVGFYDRQRSGMGVFLARSEIEKMSGISVATDIIRNMRGVHVARRPNARGSRVVGRNMCPYRYFVDDVRVGPTFELDDIPWNGIEGIEIYNGIGAIPAQYSSTLPGDGKSCGVVVVWTRIK